MKKSKKFWKNPWTVSIGSGLIILLITLLIDLITAEKVFNTLKRAISFIWKAILAFLSFDLKVWWVLVGISVVVLILILWAKFLDSSSNTSAEPEFTKYTEDEILKYRWSWVWEKNYYEKYAIENLHPICKKCKTPLTRSYSGFGRLECLRCGEVYTDILPEKENVEMLIADNVRRKYCSDE